MDRSHPEGARTARFWLFRGFEEAPYNVFLFHPSRERDGPAKFLADFHGCVKVDAYGVDGGVYLKSGARIRASCCMAHARRKFEQAKSSHPRLSAEALGLFQQLYDIEDRARELTPAQRQSLREAEAVAVLDRLRSWSDALASQTLPKLKLGEAVGYLRNQWDALANYVEDGRLPIDNNDTERDLRQLTIGRKNWMFIGSPNAGPRAATLYTVVGSALRHDLDVWAYLCDVMKHLADGYSDIKSLLPDVWAKSHPESIRTFRQHEREAKAAAKRHRRARRRTLQLASARRQ